MKKVSLLVLLIFGSIYFSIAVCAQQGQPENQPKSGTALPTPSTKKIDAGGVEAAIPDLPSPIVSWRCSHSSGMWVNNSYEAVQQEPRLGIKAEAYPTIKLTGVGIGSADPDGPSSIYRIIFNEVRYDVTVNGKNIIRRISTDDSRFKTPEVIEVGDRLEKVLKASKTKPVGVNSCFYYVKLESGWNAVFPEWDITKDGTLSANAKVSAFFKEN